MAEYGKEQKHERRCRLERRRAIVKQIERDGSPQRRICALLDECFPLTVKQIAEC